MVSSNSEVTSLSSANTWTSDVSRRSKDNDVEAGIPPNSASKKSETRRSRDVLSPGDKNAKDLDRLLVDQFELEDAYRIKTNRIPENLSSQSLQGNETLSLPDAGASQSVVSKVFTNRSTGGLSLPPDGGYGWVCCGCLTAVFLCTWGASAGSGIFLAYYLSTNAFPGATKYDYAFIAGFSVFGGQCFAPTAMILARVVGFKPTMSLGVIFLFAGFFLASFATKLWQLYLTQGVLFGLGIAFVFVPATTILPGWFLKKRSTAFGLSLLGTGAGGVIYSIAAQEMITRTGDQRWALRMLAIVCASVCAVATLLLRQRVPTTPVGFKSWKAIKEQIDLIFQWRVAKAYKINLISLWSTFALFGYNLMIFTLSPYGLARGLSSKQSSLLTVILNAAQCLGRPSIGVIGDRYGRVNITVVLTTVLIIFLFAFWITAHTFVQLVMFCICVGLCIGVGNVMNIVLIADVSGAEDFLPAWGYCNTFTSPFLLLSEVIAQALVSSKNQRNPYLYVQIFSGLCFLVALILILLLRETIVRLRFGEALNKVERALVEAHKDPASSAESTNELMLKHAFYSRYSQPKVSFFFRRMFHHKKI
ncbi:LAFA_0E08394g1_1 [Lachancea sp. 'fantastica']|nr:LAFA_0E08394g1_1 [Lachancea sp. 'fantastica']